MASTKVGGIVAELMLRDKNFANNLNKAERLTKNRTAAMKKQFQSVARSVGALAGVAGIGGLIRSQAALADTIQKGAMRAGLQNDEFQRLSHVIELGGGSMSALESAAKELNDEIGRGGSTLEKYGIQIKNLDGSEKKLREVFGEVSNALRDQATQADRVRMARDLMSRAGVDLLPVLQQGNDAIVAAGDSVTIMTDKTIEGLNRAKDSWDSFQKHITVVTGNIGTKIADVTRRFGEISATAVFGSDFEIQREQAEKQARARLGIREPDLLARLDPARLVGRDHIADREAKVQALTNEILEQNLAQQLAGEQAHKLALASAKAMEDEAAAVERATAAEQARAESLESIAEEIAGINKLTQERINFMGMDAEGQLGHFERRIDELREVANDESKSAEERRKAARELAQAEIERFRLEDRITASLEAAAFDLESGAQDIEEAAARLSLSDVANFGGNSQNAKLARRAMEAEEDEMRARAEGRPGAAEKFREKSQELKDTLMFRQEGMSPQEARDIARGIRDGDLPRPMEDPGLIVPDGPSETRRRPEARVETEASGGNSALVERLDVIVSIMQGLQDKIGVT